MRMGHEYSSPRIEGKRSSSTPNLIPTPNPNVAGLTSILNQGHFSSHNDVWSYSVCEA